MKPAWSVVLFTTLAGAGQGLFLALFAADLLAKPARGFLFAGCVVALALLGAGLLASFFHLGKPLRAWRAVAMWRTSWLSREVIVLPATMVLVLLYSVFTALAMEGAALAAGALAVVACILLFVCTGMIYACLKFLQEWASPLTLLNFAALGCASGVLLAAILAAALQPDLAHDYASAALLAGLLAYVARLFSLLRNRTLRPKSTLQSATGIRAGKLRQIAQGAMGGTFNTREFFHGRPEALVRAVRWTFLGLVFPLPAAILVAGAASASALLAAFALQFVGLLAERWYFFAEARHPQNLYYQAIA
ncbi:MAG TPA: DmsC/YnfH family molybdoenzyme membrane anchor subunit [Burkholderiales bacterium]|nr:DmsC/YnfH family molybdoenzyme membrane anchor subunit [Burkholderiales bacterium]